MALHSWPAVIALLGPPNHADAEGVALRVRWQAPAACPTIDALERQIRALAAAHFVDEDAAVDVEVTVRDVAADAEADATAESIIDARYSARLQLDVGGDVQVRQLTAQRCDLLVRATAIVVAVALDPISVATAMPERVDREPPQPANEAKPPAPSTVEPSSPRSPSRRQRDRSKVEFGGRFGVGVGGRVMPGVGPGLLLAPHVGIRRFHAQLVLEYWTPREVGLAGVAGAGATLQLATVGVRACPTFESGRWRFPLCAGVDLGALVGRGRGANLATRTTAANLWVGVVLQPGVEVAVTRTLAIWLAFEGAISLNRPSFHLLNGGRVHRAAGFEPRGFVGLVWHTGRNFP